MFIQGGGDTGYLADKDLVASLRSGLGNAYEIRYPEIQSDENKPDYGWTEQIGKAVSESGEALMLVGHSFGASMILKYLCEIDVPHRPKGIFLLATPFWQGPEDWVQGIKLGDGFADKLPDGVPLYFYHCKDDGEIPFSHFNVYRQKITKANFRAFDLGGHQLDDHLSEVARDILDLG